MQLLQVKEYSCRNKESGYPGLRVYMILRTALLLNASK
jgi:hypothetical protein